MWSSLARLKELRRALTLAAAGLLLAALSLPVWRITLEAPQYPDGLFVEMYAYPRMGGDFEEVNALNRYVGFYYPDPVYIEPNFPVHEFSVQTPEWLLGPVVFLGLAALCVFVAIAPNERKLKLGIKSLLAGTATLFVVMFAWIQFRLYQAGNSLDPNAPLRGVDSFTPPLLGWYEVANISGFAWFGPGGYLTMLAVALLGIAYLLRDSDAEIGESPALVRSLLDDIERKIDRVRAQARRR